MNNVRNLWYGNQWDSFCFGAPIPVSILYCSVCHLPCSNNIALHKDIFQLTNKLNDVMGKSHCICIKSMSLCAIVREVLVCILLLPLEQHSIGSYKLCANIRNIRMDRFHLEISNSIISTVVITSWFVSQSDSWSVLCLKSHILPNNTWTHRKGFIWAHKFSVCSRSHWKMLMQVHWFQTIVRIYILTTNIEW